MVSRRLPHLLSLSLALFPLVASAACENATLALGASPTDARSHGGDLFSALAARFGPTERDPVFDALRPKLARHALVPSGVFDPLNRRMTWAPMP